MAARPMFNAAAVSTLAASQMQRSKWMIGIITLLGVLLSTALGGGAAWLLAGLSKIDVPCEGGQGSVGAIVEEMPSRP